MTHWANIQFFPEEFLRLQKEIQYHPELQKLLANHEADEFEVKLAEIALYCEVALDGTYAPDDLVKLAKILERRLYNKRPKKTGGSGIILIN